MRTPALLLGLLLCLLHDPALADDANDEKIERVRRDLGYYKDGAAGQARVNEAQIQALRQEMQQILLQQDQRIRALEQALKLKTPPAPAAALAAPAAAAPSAASAPGQSANTLIRVCHQGCDTHDLQEAVRRAAPGAQIDIAAEINGSCAVIDKPLHIVGHAEADGSRTRLVGGVCAGKAPLVTAAADIVIENLDISDIAVGDGNGACVRMDPGTRDLTLRNINCSNSQDGLLGSSAGLLTVEDSQFIGNGFGEGQAHGIYLNGGDQAVFKRCKIIATQNAGHALKSGAAQLSVENSMIAALKSRNSRALDLFGGGNITLKHNIIEQGPESDNSDMIGLALEASRILPANHALLAEGNWFIFDRPGGNLLFRGRALGPLILRNNRIVGNVSWGINPSNESGNQQFPSREAAGLPPFDGTLRSLPNKTN
jgi:Right handed beta helix region